jgi:uncharacterized protein with PIN domain
MKFGKPFDRKKAKPKETKPVEAVTCPYCGFKTTKDLVEGAVARKHFYDADWMSRYKCPRRQKDFWVVGQYGEIKYAKPFSDTRFA